MKHNRNLICMSIMVLGIFFVSVTGYAADANVTGNWKMAVETQAGSGEATFVLAQNGEAITGSYKGALGEAPVTGTLKENNVTLNFAASGMGQEMKVQYTGTLEGDTMKGKVNMGQMGEGTFTGKKQVEPEKK